jgi:hypothetical protein
MGSMWVFPPSPVEYWYECVRQAFVVATFEMTPDGNALSDREARKEDRRHWPHVDMCRKSESDV